MTNSTHAGRYDGNLLDIGELERPFLGLASPFGAVIPGFAAVSIVRPEATLGLLQYIESLVR